MKVLRCNECGLEKTVDNFYVKYKSRCPVNRSDWCSYCSDCLKQYKADYYKKNAKKINVSHKKHRYDNIDLYHKLEASRRLAKSGNPTDLLKRRAVSSLDPRERYLYDRTRCWSYGANKRKIEWSITLEDIHKMLASQDGKCYYTGFPLVLEANSKYTLSLDRVDPEQGYIKSNVVLCCTFVNLAKLDMTVAEFREMINVLHEREW